jgi:hypothetical protein
VPAAAPDRWHHPTPTQQSTLYGFTTFLTGLSFDQALEKTIAALKTDGVGVLNDTDLQHAMKSVANQAEQRLRRGMNSASCRVVNPQWLRCAAMTNRPLSRR